MLAAAVGVDHHRVGVGKGLLIAHPTHLVAVHHEVRHVLEALFQEHRASTEFVHARRMRGLSSNEDKLLLPVGRDGVKCGKGGESEGGEEERLHAPIIRRCRLKSSALNQLQRQTDIHEPQRRSALISSLSFSRMSSRSASVGESLANRVSSMSTPLLFALLKQECLQMRGMTRNDGNEESRDWVS
jgi:hypothetical protein